MKGIVYKKLGVSILVLMLLPACTPIDWIKRKFNRGIEVSNETMNTDSSGSDNSSVLITINGKPALTLDVFNKEVDDFIEKNRLRQLIDAGLIPNMDRQYLEGRLSQLVIDERIAELGIDKKPEYIEQKEQIIKAGQQMLNAKYFTELYPITISDADLKSFYDENKDKLPDVLIARGGVNVAGIKFDNEQDGQAFLNKIKNKPDSFVQEAKSAQLDGKIKEFNLVNEQTMTLDPEVREKVLGYGKFPTTELIKLSDKSCWVVYAKDKKDAQCRPFTEVKATIEQYVNRQKRMEILEKEIEKLKEKYNVVVNDSLLKAKAAKQQITFNEEDATDVMPSENSRSL